VSGVRQRTGVILCPPFGWEELWAYRSYVAWANALAGEGYPALRFDLPGTGDSGGSAADIDCFRGWQATISAGASHLRVAVGCTRVVALGVGLGGLLACEALAAGAPIDDLALWAVASSGHLQLRESRAYARFVRAASTGVRESEDPVLEDGSLDLAGFVLAADAVRALEALDLTELAIPAATALLLDRDSLPFDRRLHEHLLNCGVQVTTASGPGYSAMMDLVFPREPRETFATTIDWLGNERPERAAGELVAPTVSDAVELELDRSQIRESPFEVDRSGELMRGILTEPVERSQAQLCAVFVNGAAIRRIGTQRLWVQAARRFATRGVPTLRLDLLGFGESDGDSGTHADGDDGFYRESITGDVRAALDALERRGLGTEYLVAGLCSGGFRALDVALHDDRVRAPVMVNPGTFDWQPGMFHPARVELNLRRYARLTASLVWHRRLSELRGRVRDEKLASRAFFTIILRARRLTLRGPLERRFAVLSKRGAATTLVIGRDDYVEPQLKSLGLSQSTEPWPGVMLERIPAHDHMFVSLDNQRLLHEALDRALGRALGG
jgi:pimeloyl-ACP methyl ester carboxylesterase